MCSEATGNGGRAHSPDAKTLKKGGGTKKLIDDTDRCRNEN